MFNCHLNAEYRQPAPIVPQVEDFYSLSGAKEIRQPGVYSGQIVKVDGTRCKKDVTSGDPQIESYYGIMPVQEPMSDLEKVSTVVSRQFMTSTAANSQKIYESDSESDDDEEDQEGLPGLSLSKNWHFLNKKIVA